MAPKKPVKTPVRAKKSLSKTMGKAEKPQTPVFLVHWLHDASLETGGPVRAFGPGERQLDMLVRANHVTISKNGHVRLELRLRAHIHTEKESLAVAEIKYAGVVEKLHDESAVPAVLADLYPFARQALEGVLALAGQKAPLPATLEANKSQ
jgi:preprotein translocase subunit SecB